MIDFTSIQQMLEDTKTGGLPLWQNIMVSDCARQGIDRTLSWGQMERLLDAMEQADRDYRDTDRSVSGLVGGDGGRMARYGDGGDTLCGPFLSEVMAGALRMGECNSCMKRIVAAPTAGSCGVLPAVLLPCGRRFGLPRDKAFKDFSRGMKMKLAIAVALSHQAKLLILDEATSGLDPMVRDEILDIFNEYTRQEDRSILLSSHIVSDLEKICDYIAFLHKGKLVLCEEKDRLLEEYALVRLSHQRLADLPEVGVVGVENDPYGVRALVRRDKVPHDLPLEHTNLEDIILFLAKGGTRR